MDYYFVKVPVAYRHPLFRSEYQKRDTDSQRRATSSPPLSTWMQISELSVYQAMNLLSQRLDTALISAAFQSRVTALTGDEIELLRV